MDPAERGQHHRKQQQGNERIKIMDGAYKAFVRRHGTCVVEEFARKSREDAVLRLARIQNGADKRYTNGKSLVPADK